MEPLSLGLGLGLEQMGLDNKSGHESCVRPDMLHPAVCTFDCFCPRDVVSAVYATATCWLAGWLAGCLSHAGIVSKRLGLNLS